MTLFHDTDRLHQDAMLTAQLQAMNSAYAPHSIQFALKDDAHHQRQLGGRRQRLRDDHEAGAAEGHLPHPQSVLPQGHG